MNARRWGILAVPVLGLAAAAGGAGDSRRVGASGDTLRVGYSAWPGWFPLAVADRQGFFDEAGLDVELTYFVDYTASLDALVAGNVDVNAQTLNDTMLGVAAGSDQRIVVTNDNSTGNDAVICDATVTSIPDLKGQTIAAEAGVVDHFLLLQGLAKEGMTGIDIEFSACRPMLLPRPSPEGSSTASQYSRPSRCKHSNVKVRRCCSAPRTSRARSPITWW